MAGKDGSVRKLLRQNLRARQGLAALGVLAAVFWAAGAKPPVRRHKVNAMEESDALREKLAAQSSELLRLDHAMRTPIGAARAALAILESATDDHDLQAEARQVIERQLARMTALTEELRDLAQRHPD